MRYALLIACLIGGAIALGLLPPGTQSDITLLEHGWQYRWTRPADLSPLEDAWSSASWSPLDLPAHPPSGEDGAPMLWLRTRLPERLVRDPAIAIDAVTAPFEAYLGHARIHVFPHDEGLETNAASGIPWQLISLPLDSAGQVFALRVRASGFTAVVRGTPLAGGRSDLIAWTIDRDLIRLITGCCIALFGLLGLFTLIKKDDWRVPVGFAMTTVASGLYIINYTHLKELVLDAPRFWFYVWVIAVPAVPLGTSMMVDELFGTGPKGLLRRLLQSQLVVALCVALSHVVSTVLYGLGREWEHASLSVFHATLNALRVTVLAWSAIMLATIIDRARKKEPDAGLWVIGYGTYFAFVVRDLLAAFGVAALSWKSQVHLGSLVLTISMMVVLSRRYGAAHRRAAAFALEALSRAKEKERMLRDLHDGVGSLTSNVRMLAELGQRSDRRAGAALATIAELSDKALLELRSFVTTLDESTLSWDGLVAEMRRFGAQLVEARSIALAMEIAVQAEGKPTGLLCLHVVRIFREALTNALKQTAVTRVAVKLNIDRERFELVIENDGGLAARSTGGIGANRGLDNMRARAKELGGSLDVVLEDEVRVRLLIPLPLISPIVSPSDALSSGAK